MDHRISIHLNPIIRNILHSSRLFRVLFSHGYDSFEYESSYEFRIQRICVSCVESHWGNIESHAVPDCGIFKLNVGSCNYCASHNSFFFLSLGTQRHVKIPYSYMHNFPYASLNSYL